MSLRMEDRKEDSRMMSLDCATIEKITQLNSTAATHFILKDCFFRQVLLARRNLLLSAGVVSQTFTTKRTMKSDQINETECRLINTFSQLKKQFHIEPSLSTSKAVLSTQLNGVARTGGFTYKKPLPHQQPPGINKKNSVDLLNSPSPLSSL